MSHSPNPFANVSPAPPDEARLHHARGVAHLAQGKSLMPYALSEGAGQKGGADLLMAFVGLAAVAASRALGQTRWIEQYRAEMRTALLHFDRAAQAAPLWAENHFKRAQTLRYLGETEAAKEAAQMAATLEPGNTLYQSFARDMAQTVSVAPPRPASRYRVQGEETAKTDAPLTWDNVILPAKTKRELRQMQLVLENPQQARTLGVEPPSGLLLYGPPGTGKTTVARVLAAQAHCQFLAASPSQINNMWMGESEKAVAKLFADARAQAPAIVFLDEIDALIPTRSGGMHQYSDKVVNQFLHEMDGLKPSAGVFVVGATNRPDMLDAALLRGGRLSRMIEIPLPDEEARTKLLALYTHEAQIAPDVDIATLAGQTDGWSGADLKALVSEAGLQALIRLSDEGGAQAVTRADFEVALENLTPNA